MSVEYEDLSEETRQKLIEEAAEYRQDEGKSSRREVLQNGAIGLAALFGLSGSVSAQPSADGTIGAGSFDLPDFDVEQKNGNFVISNNGTVIAELTEFQVLQSISQVGLPGDRVDVYADGVDSTLHSTDSQTINSSLSYQPGVYSDIDVLGSKVINGAGGQWFFSDAVFTNGITTLFPNGQNTGVEVFRRIKDLSPGTASNPTVVEWDAKLLNVQAGADQYIGLGERFPSFPSSGSIFFALKGSRVAIGDRGISVSNVAKWRDCKPNDNLHIKP